MLNKVLAIATVGMPTNSQPVAALTDTPVGRVAPAELATEHEENEYWLLEAVALLYAIELEHAVPVVGQRLNGWLMRSFTKTETVGIAAEPVNMYFGARAFVADFVA
jgi:hypothetical protein